MRRLPVATGLEGAPDIMLLTMAGLMVAIVWLVAHAHEATLPPIDLPREAATALGAYDRASSVVSIRPTDGGGIAVWIDDLPVPGGLDGLEAALGSARAQAITLRADASTGWEHGVRAMTIASRLGLEISVAASR